MTHQNEAGIRGNIHTISPQETETPFAVAYIYSLGILRPGTNMKSAPPCCKGLAALAQVSYLHLSTLILCFLHTVPYIKALGLTTDEMNVV